jgi:N-acetylmuramoyl-L-alanine amidase
MKDRMTWGAKTLRWTFARVSLGFALLSGCTLPFQLSATTANSSVRREAASSQFTRAEELRAILNSKAANQRTLAEYKKVVTGYQRVYLITPHAVEVPDALTAVAELNTEMGDRFGRSYYQTAADTYAYLVRDYPTSKRGPDAMLRLASLQKDQLGDLAAATKTYQDFAKKYPRSPHKLEVQEALAELALRRNAETGEVVAKNPVGTPAATPAKADIVSSEGRQTISGGEAAKSVAVPRVQKIRTSVSADSTEVVIDLEDSVQFASGRIANPDRIYFDLHAARLSPGMAGENIQVSGNLLTGVRVAQNKAGVVRVVMDVEGVRDYEVSLSKKPARLVIELYSSANRANPDSMETAKTTKSAPASRVSASAGSRPLPKETVASGTIPPPEIGAKSQATNGTMTGDLAAANPPPKPEPAPSRSSLVRTSDANSKTKPELVQPVAAPQPTRDGQSTLTRALGLKIGRIVIDAGHGGHDTGTIGPTGLMEKDLCLDVALRLGKLILQKLPGAEVVYTRSDDTFIPLEERTNIANEAQADLFLSIHANSSPDHGARGVETYYLNLKGSPDAMEVAARENAVSQQGVHDLEDLVKKIARTEKIDESKELAEDIQDSLSKRMQRTAKPVKNRGVRKAPFVVLIGADMPSILTEISFLSNASDEQLLKKPEHRQRIAEGVYQGVAAYLQSMNSVALNSSARPNRAPMAASVEQSRNQK